MPERVVKDNQKRKSTHFCMDTARKLRALCYCLPLVVFTLGLMTADLTDVSPQYARHITSHTLTPSPSAPPPTLPNGLYPADPLYVLSPTDTSHLTSESETMRLNVPIYFVILIATLMSTSSSIGGGLIIYLESLRSLEAGVRTASASEVFSLQEALRTVDRKVVEQVLLVKNFFFLANQVRHNDSAEWTRQMTALFFAQVNSSQTTYYLAMQLLPYQPKLNATNTVYVSVWSDILSTGGRLMVYGEAGPHRGKVISDTGMLLVDCYSLAASGEVSEYLYLWEQYYTSYAEDGVTYTVDPAADIMENDPIRPPPYAHAVNVPGAHAERYAGPRYWHSPDLALIYSYHNIDAMFAPPPPPHPWAHYRAIRITYGYLSDLFLNIFETFHNDADTEVYLVNRRPGKTYGRVLAATVAGFSVVPANCQGVGMKGDVAELSGCYTNVTHHLPKEVGEAFRAVDAVPDTFLKHTCGDEAFFLRGARVGADLLLVWMRPVSVVQGKVNDALYLLLVFVLLVLLFDAFVSVSEIVFIAIPLHSLAASITATGALNTEDASDLIVRFRNKVIMVSEIRSLMEGMAETIAKLNEFRTFIPLSAQEGISDQSSSVEAEEVSSEDTVCSGNTASLASAASIASMARSQTSQMEAFSLNMTHFRPMAVLVSNIVNWHEEVGGDPSDAFTTKQSTLVTVICASVKRFKGSVDFFFGDRFLLGWSTAKKQSEYTLHCGECALNLSDTFTVLGYRSSFGFCVAQGRAGNAGNNQVRRFAVVSPAIAQANTLERYGKAMGIDVVTDGRAISSLQNNNFVFRVLDGIRYPKDTEPTALIAVMTKHAIKDEEWMYQLAQVGQDNPHCEMNQYLLSVLAGVDAKPKLQPPTGQPIPKQFLQAQAQRFEPIELVFSRGGGEALKKS